MEPHSHEYQTVTYVSNSIRYWIMYVISYYIPFTWNMHTDYIVRLSNSIYLHLPCPSYVVCWKYRLTPLLQSNAPPNLRTAFFIKWTKRKTKITKFTRLTTGKCKNLFVYKNTLRSIVPLNVIPWSKQSQVNSNGISVFIHLLKGGGGIFLYGCLLSFVKVQVLCCEIYKNTF